MERLAGGVVHIPIFLNSLQNGLYYAQILVCSTGRIIPYDGPNEDLDLSASYVIPAAGTLPPILVSSADVLDHSMTMFMLAYAWWCCGNQA